MYVPKHFEQTDERALWDFVDEYPFGTLLTIADGQPFASHVPFLVDRAARRLNCHVARANPQWLQLASSPSVLAIFAGPHGYVSPTWYVEPGGVHRCVRMWRGCDEVPVVTASGHCVRRGETPR